MGAYQDWFEEKDCAHCGTHNHVYVGEAGERQANETEAANCCSCGKKIASMKCFRIGTGTTQAAAKSAAFGT